MLPLAGVVQVLTIPGQTLGVSLFNPYFRSDLGLSALQVSFAYMLGTLLASVPQTYIGALFDKYGLRIGTALITVLLGGTCMAVSQVSGVVTLFLGFFLLRMLGQGALSLSASNTLAMWFNRRLGRVAGIKSLGVGLAFGLAPGGILFLIQRYGWRTSYVLFGVAVWGIILPLLFLLYRNRPEDVGLICDGNSEEVEEDQSSGAEASLNLRQALGTRAYWIMGWVVGCWAMVGTGFMFHIVPFTKELGLGESDAVAVMFYYWTLFAVFQFIGGFLADRFPLNFLMAASMAMIVVGLFVTAGAKLSAQAQLGGGLLGGAQGLMAAASATLWVRYYGRAHLGKIRGSINTSIVAFSALGGIVIDLLRVKTGSYQGVFSLFIYIFVPAIVLALFATQPARKGAPNAIEPA